ncbi:hypothetical protein, partial [Archangium sp.]|uniref:hypothetical protein n=1 Tax=Archangium sp. TaxID=1872627 RepID=UPI002D5370B2
AVAFVFALAQLVIGVEAFFPRNSVTTVLYLSNDVGAERALRIPAVFNTSHAYGGCMLLSLPLLVRRWQRISSRWSRVLTVGVLMASVLGLFICAARSPVAQLVVILGLLLLVTGLPLKLLAGVTGLAAVVGLVVAANPRFQRFLTLEDTRYVSDRVSLSVNTNLFDVLSNYPLGNGLGSAAGTSIPFFLSHLARPQFGLENEFARIAMEQGFIGLVLWVLFLGWLFTRLPPRRRGGSLVAERMMWATILTIWATAVMGTGTLSSIPGTTFLLLWMGIIVGTRRPAPVPKTRLVAPKAPAPQAPITEPQPGLSGGRA